MEKPGNLTYRRHMSESPLAPNAALFTTPPPSIDSALIRAFLAEEYDLRADVTPLHSERDANYLISSSGEKYLFKISNSVEPETRIIVNTKILAFLETNTPNLPLPRIVKTRNGCRYTKAGFGTRQSYVVRLFTFLDGIPLIEIPNHRHPLVSIGELAGRLTTALRDFRHTNMRYDLLWDSSRVDTLSPLLGFIPDTGHRRSIEAGLSHFAIRVKPRLSKLHAQMIHNDINLSNVLLSRHDSGLITGLIDFGDAVVAPAINELAVLCSYQLHGNREPVALLCSLLRGFHSKSPLRRDEIILLPDLIIARLMTTTLITHWRAALFPDNRAYILRHNPKAREGLEIFRKADQSEMVSKLLEACGVEQ